jgi:hypothetical protein
MTRRLNLLFAMGLASLLVGCTVAKPLTQQQLTSIAQAEAPQVAKPSRPLSTFATIELKPFGHDQSVRTEPKKMEYANEFEARVRSKLAPLFREWAARNSAGQAGPLIVEANVRFLKITSYGARVVGGGFVAPSNIILELRLIDSRTGKTIGSPTFTRREEAWPELLNTYFSDLNLIEYLTLLIHRYFEING